MAKAFSICSWLMINELAYINRMTYSNILFHTLNNSLFKPNMLLQFLWTVSQNYLFIFFRYYGAAVSFCHVASEFWEAIMLVQQTFKFFKYVESLKYTYHKSIRLIYKEKKKL